MEEFTGTIENWYTIEFADATVVSGIIYGDVRGRFHDGNWIRTSAVVELGDDYVITKNSKYKLGAKFVDMSAKEI